MVAPGTRRNDDACYLPSENETGRATGRRTASTRDRPCPRKHCGHPPRYLKHKITLCAFVHVEGLEPTNNLSERQARHGVLWRKMYLGTQSEAGSRLAERIMTVVAALKQQERNAFEYLTEACDAANWGRPAPSLLPMSPPLNGCDVTSQELNRTPGRRLVSMRDVGVEGDRIVERVSSPQQNPRCGALASGQQRRSWTAAPMPGDATGHRVSS